LLILNIDKDAIAFPKG